MEVYKMNLADWQAMLSWGFLCRRALSNDCSFKYKILERFQKS